MQRCLGVSEHTVGGRRYLRTAAISSWQSHQRGLRVALREASEVAAVGTGEGVDGLGWIAHHANIVVVAQPALQQPLLQGRDVLVLIHGHMAQARAQVGGHARLTLQQGHHEEQDVFEIHSTGCVLARLVDREQLRHALSGEIGRHHPPRLHGGLRVSARSQAMHFGPLDLRCEVPHRRR